MAHTDRPTLCRGIYLWVDSEPAEVPSGRPMLKTRRLDAAWMRIQTVKLRPTILLATILALSASASYAATPVNPPDQMQQRFDQMQTMMDQAQQATTPADRQKLMTEHMAKMQDQMASMKGMMAPGGMMSGAGMMSGPGMKPGDMRPGGMNSGGMMPQGKGAAASDTNATSQIAAMQQRMNAMQNMMGQMLQEQKLMMKPSP